MKFEITTHSAKETAKFGKRLGELINQKCVIAFIGGMGSGKTCFTSGLCRGIGFLGDVTSPTFAIVNEYQGGRLPIFHFDMYRIDNEDELYSIGFYDYLDQNGVSVVEWSENIEYALPSDSVYITFTNCNENNRTITIDCVENKDFLKELLK